MHRVAFSTNFESLKEKVKKDSYHTLGGVYVREKSIILLELFNQ